MNGDAVAIFRESTPRMRRGDVGRLLSRDDVVVFVEAYAGSTEPGRLVEAARKALRLDRDDASILALLLERRRRQVADELVYDRGPHRIQFG